MRREKNKIAHNRPRRAIKRPKEQFVNLQRTTMLCKNEKEFLTFKAANALTIEQFSANPVTHAQKLCFPSPPFILFFPSSSGLEVHIMCTEAERKNKWRRRMPNKKMGG